MTRIGHGRNAPVGPKVRLSGLPGPTTWGHVARIDPWGKRSRCEASATVTGVPGSRTASSGGAPRRRPRERRSGRRCYSGLLLYSDGPPPAGVEHEERTLPPLPVQRQRSTPTDG